MTDKRRLAKKIAARIDKPAGQPVEAIVEAVLEALEQERYVLVEKHALAQMRKAASGVSGDPSPTAERSR